MICSFLEERGHMRFFKTYLLPGLIFQSVVIGGGYATGRELVEFFFASGPIGGLLGLLVSGIIFSIVCAVGFELARIAKAFDYRTFCKQLLGKGWFLFEIFYFFQLLLVLSVIGSASGQIASQNFGVPSLVGTLALMLFIGVLTYKGSDLIKKVLAGWSVLLYGVYIVLFILAFKSFGADINNIYATAPVGEGWLLSGVLYSGYNLATLPTVLFVIAYHQNRRETIGAGLISGAVTVIPAALFFVAMMGQYPQIGNETVPATYLMATLNIGWFEVLFQIVVFGTFVETGTALLHAVNERLAGTFAEQRKTLPKIARPIISVFFLTMAVIAAEVFGIVNLIAKGYGLITIAFIIVLVIPLMTVGVCKIIKKRNLDNKEVKEA